MPGFVFGAKYPGKPGFFHRIIIIMRWCRISRTVSAKSVEGEQRRLFETRVCFRIYMGNGECKMKRKKKKILAFLLALTLMVSLMGKDQLFVAAENAQTVETESSAETQTVEETGQQNDAVPEAQTVSEEEPVEDEDLPADDADGSDPEQSGEGNGEGSTGKSPVSTEESTETVTTQSPSEETSTVESSSAKEDLGTEEPEEETSAVETTEEETTEETTEEETTEETEETETVTEEETETEDGSFKGSEDDPWEAEADGIKIKAYADKGVLPEDAVMKVGKLSEDSEEYKKARELVEASGTEFNEMMALDISFEAENDEGEAVEIEPDGTVRVTMELPEIIPANVEEDSLTINHIKEDEEGELLEAVPVADKGNDTEGTIEVVDTASEDTQDVKAEFVTDGFSIFTITWNEDSWFDERTVTVKYVDENGTELGGFSQTDINNLETGDSILLKDYAPGLSEYVYQGARIESVGGTPLTELRVGQRNYSYGVSLQYRNGEENWKTLSNGSNILLVYKRTSTPTEPVTPTVEMSHEKYVTDREDGTYDLTLTIAGAAGSQQHKQKLDVIFVLDKSGSMKDPMGDTNRRAAAGDAISEMVDSLSVNENIDTRYALVTFSGNNDKWDPDVDAEVSVAWTANGNSIKSGATPPSNGGTNYQAGIIEAKELLEQKRDGALTAVIFISDGNPTFRYGTNKDGSVDKNSTQGNGNSDPNDTNLSAAQTEMKTLKSDFFYTIGVGDPDEFDNLKYLITGKNGSAYYTGGISGNYEGTDETSLKKAFDSIQASITTILCSNVTVTDQLSENVSIVTSEAGEYEALKITVEDKDGKEVASGNNSVTFEGVTISAFYNNATKKIRMDFPDDYELKEGYTYLVTAHIEPTEEAYEAYRVKGNAYPDTGESGTGTTSAGQLGMYSNEKSGAIVTYTYNGKEQTAYYPMPVVQLHPAVLKIEKKIAGLNTESDEYGKLCSTLTFNVSFNGTVEQITLDSFEYDSESEKFVYTKSGISPGTVYRISEDQQSLAVEGYDCIQTTGDGGKPIEYAGSFAKDGTVTASFCNSYTPSNHVLTIKKAVGGNMGDTEKEFDFTLVVKDKNNESYTDDIPYVKCEAGKEENDTSGVLAAQDGNCYKFKLKHDQSIELTLPSNCNYTITESNGDYGVEITNSSDNAKIENNTITRKLEQDISVLFTNKREIVTPPTGIYTNNLPWIFMILTAFAAALWFALTRRRRD